MDNLTIYNNVKAVPENAQKPIVGGRLKGMTDINPMWRIKTLTEQFGVCGFGWKYEITEKRLEKGGKDEIAAFIDINLYIKVAGEWSDAIPGTGGSSFVASETKGPYTSDECFKMALTDALSVACKALGFGADVYWSKDGGKYDRSSDAGDYTPPKTGNPPATPPANTELITKPQANRIFALSGGNKEICMAVLKTYGYTKSEEIKKTHYDAICKAVQEVAADHKS